jgi:hypothetical protein
VTTAIEVLSELAARGVAVRVEGDALKLKPASALDAGLLERVREAKREIVAALARPTVQPGECPHCEGKGECDCRACTLRRTEKPVPCLMCHAQERQVWLAATRPETCWHCGGAGKCECISCEKVCGVCGGSGKERRN